MNCSLIPTCYNGLKKTQTNKQEKPYLIVLCFADVFHDNLKELPLVISLYHIGLVPEETEESNDGEANNEDSKLQDLPPCWGLDIVCGKGTDFNYGPWADRQRYYHDLWPRFYSLISPIFWNDVVLLFVKCCIHKDLIFLLLLFKLVEFLLAYFSGVYGMKYTARW